MSTGILPSTSFDSVTGYLSWDHDRLERLLADSTQQVQEARWADASETYGFFERGLDRHIRLEEEILFPVFEARTGIVDGPTAVMREEHRTIRRTLALMRGGIDKSDARAFRDGVDFMRSLMSEHNAREEHVLYPTTDRLLSDRDRAKLAARLQRE